ncbi:MAG: glycosyltransferase [Rhizomicrobium sp.]
MNGVHVIAGLSDAHGGPSYSVPRLCKALGKIGVKTTLLSVAAAGARPGNKSCEYHVEKSFAWDFCNVPLLRDLRKSSGLTAALRGAASSADLIHNHGLWLMPNIVAGREAARARKPLVLSPRGMLSPAALAYSRMKKRAVWSLLQGPAVRSAACIHATSEQEYHELRALGLVNPIAVIPNGIDLPDLAALPSTKAERIVLSLGRIHPKKALDRLLRAWAALEPDNPTWRLRIAGPGEGGHDDKLRALAESLGLKRASIENPVYGDAKLMAYRDADLFVLPTLNENFGLTVAEALAAGTPAISTKGAPWSGLESEGCGWWIDHGVEPLTAALNVALMMPREELSSMGAKGRAWVARDFSWDSVAGNMKDVYSWLAERTPPPPTVRFDI